MPDKTPREIELERLLIEQEEHFYKQIDALNKKHQKELKDKDEKYSKLEQKFAELQEKFNKVLIEKEKKTDIIKINNHNKYVGTKENGEVNEDNASPINEVEQNLEKEKKKRGRPKGSKNYAKWDLASLASSTIENDIAPELIAKGYKLVKIGEDESYLIRVRKEIEVVKVVTPKYIRSDIKEDKIYQALSKAIFPHSVCTASLAADIINAKYNLDVPIYRYSNYLNDKGIYLSEMDLTNFVKRADNLLLPLYKEIKSKIINNTAKVINIDETPIEILDYLKLKGDEHQENGYVFVYVTSYYNNPIYLYDFSKTRETTKTQVMLNDYKGYVVADGYPGYDALKGKGIKIQLCFAHIRRKFYDIAKVLSPELKKKSVAQEMVNRIDKLFRIEAKLKEEKKTPLEIYNYRQSDKYMKIVNDIYDYLDLINPEKGTLLYDAVNYFRNGKEDSKTFLLDGHIPISNNIAERAIKPFTIMRRNVLFCKTEKGAEISGRLFTIIQTARANRLVVEDYLTYAMENINNTPIKDLLPWSESLPSNLKIK